MKKEFKYKVEIEEYSRDGLSEIVHNIVMWNGEFEVFYLDDGEIDYENDERDSDIENISFIGDGKPFDYLFYDEDDNEYEPYLRSTYDEKYFEDEESAKTYYDSLVKKYIKD